MSSGTRTREKRERRMSSPVAALLAGKRKKTNTPSSSPASASVSEKLSEPVAEGVKNNTSVSNVKDAIPVSGQDVTSAATNNPNNPVPETDAPPVSRLEDVENESTVEMDISSVPTASEVAAKTSSNRNSPTPAEVETTPTCIFKNPTFVHSSKEGVGPKKKTWKNLKQLITMERTLLQPDDVSYMSIEAPPSFTPAKKYCDITGLEAKYTDPHTKLRYARTEEYARIRMLPSDIVTGLLALRKANSTVQ